MAKHLGVGALLMRKVFSTRMDPEEAMDFGEKARIKSLRGLCPVHRTWSLSRQRNMATVGISVGLTSVSH